MMDSSTETSPCLEQHKTGVISKFMPLTCNSQMSHRKEIVNRYQSDNESEDMPRTQIHHSGKMADNMNHSVQEDDRDDLTANCTKYEPPLMLKKHLKGTERKTLSSNCDEKISDTHASIHLSCSSISELPESQKVDSDVTSAQLRADSAAGSLESCEQDHEQLKKGFAVNTAPSVSTFVYGICGASSPKRRKRKEESLETGDEDLIEKSRDRDEQWTNTTSVPGLVKIRDRTVGASIYSKDLKECGGRNLPECSAKSHRTPSKEHESGSARHAAGIPDIAAPAYAAEQHEALDLSKVKAKPQDGGCQGATPACAPCPTGNEAGHISYIPQYKEEAEERKESDGMKSSKRGFLSITGLIQKCSTPMMKRYKMRKDQSKADGFHGDEKETSDDEEMRNGESGEQEDVTQCGLIKSAWHGMRVNGGLQRKDDNDMLTSRAEFDVANGEDIIRVNDNVRQQAVLSELSEKDDEDKPFKCKECGKGFRLLQGRTAHMKIHSDARPFPCPHCDQCFRVKQNLVTHVRTHTGEKPHCCEVCGRGFGQQSTLVRHLRSHTGERPYTCEYCGRTFSQRHVMMNHTRIHTGERPYSCEVCGKGFKEQHNMVRHLRTHTGEKPYTCTECGNKFTQQNHLMRHAKVHIPKKHTI